MNQPSRRDFLKTSAATVSAGFIPYWFASQSATALGFDTPHERPVVGSIGTGGRWGQFMPNVLDFGDIAAVCDVDAQRANDGAKKVKDGQGSTGKSSSVDIYEDYRKILDRKDIDVVTIATPDHWHTKIAIEAMQAGKDVYCEKPLTLTIDEGKQIIKVLDETNRVFQVGTQQRSEFGSQFLKAIALIHDGRIGKVKKVHVVLGNGPAGGPFAVPAKPPAHLNWEMWQGQTPLVDYIEKRCHYEFRWWYEYSGGKMTDWGAHHIDITQWAIGMDHSGPISVKPSSAQHPCPMENGYPTIKNVYNTASQFRIHCKFPNGTDVIVMNYDAENNIKRGILFEGEKGRFYVGRHSMTGKPIEDLKNNPLPEDALVKLYKGKEPGNHMGNFFDCVKTRELPISDVYTHHRAVTTCHLCNIAIRLNREIKWDPQTEQIVGDKEAQMWQSREQRKGYEINV